MMYRVFFYGTLKRGQPNNDFLNESKNGLYKFVGVGETIEKYPLVIASQYNIPFLLFKPNVGHFVEGEIYDVDERMFQSLDQLEDHPNVYERSLSKIKLLNTGELTDCWVYFLKRFQPKLLEQQFFPVYESDGSHGLKYLKKCDRAPGSIFIYKNEVLEPSN